MGQYITATSFVIPTVTATSASSSWPVSNVTSLTRPHRVYKSSSAAGTAEAIVLDMGATQALQALMIDRCNVATVVIQGNATNVWTSPSYAATVAVNQDTLDGRRKLFHNLIGSTFESVGYRYARIRPNGTVTQYGGTVWEVGAVALMGTARVWGTNMGFPYGREYLQASDEGQRIGGGVEPSALGNPGCRITLSTNAMDGTMQATIDELMRAGDWSPIVYYNNGTTTAETYLCHRVGSVRVDFAGPGYLQVAALVLEEFI